MSAIELAAANLTTDQRDNLKAVSLNGTGSFPIPNVQFLRKAVLSFGRCPPQLRDALVRHIAARAKALGATDLDWVKNFLAAHGANS